MCRSKHSEATNTLAQSWQGGLWIGRGLRGQVETEESRKP